MASRSSRDRSHTKTVALPGSSIPTATRSSCGSRWPGTRRTSRADLLPRPCNRSAREASERDLPRHLFAVVPVQLVRLAVLHDAGDLGDELLVVPGAAQEVEAHLHAAGDAARGDDAAGV